MNPDILEKNVWEHRRYYNYSKVVLTKDTKMKSVILRDLYEIMLLKDVARIISIEDI